MRLKTHNITLSDGPLVLRPIKVLITEEKTQELILKERPAHEIRNAAVASGNFTTLKENAIEKVLQGITTLEEAASVVMADGSGSHAQITG